MSYFELYDDMSTDQRWYLDDPAGPSGEWLNSALVSCLHYEGPTPLTCRVFHSGPHLELTMAQNYVPVVNERVAGIITKHAEGDVQLISARASESDEKLWVVNILANPDCIDEAHSADVRRYTAADGEPDRIGEYKVVGGMRIDPARTGGHAIFRPRGWWVVVVVNETLGNALKEAGVRCMLTPVS
jgi:hypothetical protein